MRKVELKPGQLVEHKHGYRGIILNPYDDELRICVFFHPHWPTGAGRAENWSFHRSETVRSWFKVLQNAG